MKNGSPVSPAAADLRLSAAALSSLLLLSACALGPDFTRPQTAAGERYTPEALPAQTAATEVSGGAAQKLVAGAEIPAQWWQLFGSPLISQRVAEALAHSPSLAAAQAALRQAQENVNAAVGAYYPAFSADGSATRAKTNTAASPGSNSSYYYTLYGASVNVSYTLDLFGATRRGVEAQRAAAEYQQFQLEGAYLTLAANVVTASVQEASLQTQLSATEDILKSREEQFAITQKQYELGAIARTDLLAAQSQLESTRATLPALRQQLAQVRSRLAVYLGRMPAEQEISQLDLNALTLPQDVPVSLPSQLTQQRPDIRAAEAQLHQATASLGVATANLFPKLTLSAGYGSQAGASNELFKSPAEIWNIAGGLSAPLFQGGTLRANKRAAQAALDQAYANYRLTVLQGFANVSDSLNALQNDAQALQSRHASLQAAEQNLDLVQKSYRAGAVGYLNVLDAQRQQQQARIDFITAQSARYNDTAALLQALGGGWWNRQTESGTAVAASAP